MQQSVSLNVLGQPEILTRIDAIVLAQGNHILNLPVLAIGTALNTSIKITNATQILADYKGGTVSAQEVAFTAGNAQFTGVNDILGNATVAQERCYMLSATSAGVVTITAEAQMGVAGNAPLPERLATGNAPIGFLRILVAAGTAGFRGGTTALNAVGITVTYNDGYPQRLSSKAQ